MAGLDPWIVLTAFGGGFLGAMLGGFTAFILCGFAAIIGAAIFMVTGDPTFNNLVTWGPFLGPHVAFTGGAAAAAYAARRGELDSGRNLLKPLVGLGSWPVLLVGGLFGVLGLVLNWLLQSIPHSASVASVNSIATAIVAAGFIIRLRFGSTGLLARANGGSRWGPENKAEGFPWHMRPRGLLLLGGVLSLFVGFVVRVLPGSSGLMFGLSTIALTLFLFGIQIPVTHHISLTAAFMVLVTGDILWSLPAGLLAAFLSEIFSCLVLRWGDTHIDPPALAIVVVYSLYAVLNMFGVPFPAHFLPLLLTFAIGTGGYAGLVFLRRHVRPDNDGMVAK